MSQQQHQAVYFFGELIGTVADTEGEPGNVTLMPPPASEPGHKPAQCEDCQQAESNWQHNHYTAACPDCVVREIARSRQHLRQAALEHVQRQCGPDARRILAQKLKDEDQRIRLLRLRNPKH